MAEIRRHYRDDTGLVTWLDVSPGIRPKLKGRVACVSVEADATGADTLRLSINLEPFSARNLATTLLVLADQAEMANRRMEIDEHNRRLEGSS